MTLGYHNGADGRGRVCGLTTSVDVCHVTPPVLPGRAGQQAGRRPLRPLTRGATHLHGLRHGIVHVGPRRHRGVRGAGHAGAGLPHLGHDDPVGDDRLPARPRCRDPGHRLGGRPLRRQAGLDDVPRRVHTRLRPLRALLVGHFAHRLPSGSGPGRWVPASGGTVDPGSRRRSPTDGSGHEHRRRPARARTDPRARPRRCDRVQLQLAVDLLHQHPDRDRHDAALTALALPLGQRRTVSVSLRHARILSPLTGPHGARLRAFRGGNHRQLYRGPRPHQLHRRGCAARCVRRPRAAQRPPTVRAALLPSSQFRHLEPLHLRPGCHAVRRHVPLAALLPGGAAESRPGWPV